MQELSKAYEAKLHEDSIYKKWEDSKAFEANVNPEKQPFTIVLPPPNATGTLHLGHASRIATEDTIIRFKRMQGFEALWLPGIDHAAIATQNKVEKELLKKEGKTRHQYERQEFLSKVEDFVEESKTIITNQIRRMGASVDWRRLTYTLEPKVSRAVYEVFQRMYKDGLIYQGNRIVNWCPRCSSTLADDEIKYKEQHAKFYFFRYGPVIIGTARPETKFLDKVIVAHPDDVRYQEYFGKTITVPWIDGEVEATFIADESADPKFGSGAMTITPAHDFTDFEIAKKHQLDIVQIIDEKGNFTEIVGSEFAGKNARKSREAIVKKLAEKSLLERVDENYINNLPICYRCDTPIEPLVSKQWFIDVNKPIYKEGDKLKSIKEKCNEAVENGSIEIIPERFQKTYFQWMENLRDWCISRQIWFGHRIPVWYCLNPENPACKEPIVSVTNISSCPHCHSDQIKQDEDTLDTWFSSGLWTFSTLGWPDQTPDLEYFHPTNLLETAYDILFFWVARMIIMTTYVFQEIPFKQVLLSGLVLDKNGKKMSKSKDNGIDPLEMIEKFGTDAVRLSLIIGSTPGNDMRLYEEKIAGYRNFVNKIWNGSRFVLLSLENLEQTESFTPHHLKTEADKWIVSKLQNLILEVTQKIEKYQLSEAGNQIYEFFWDEFCSWYIEFSKGEHLNQPVLKYVLETLLKLLHPFTPFVTEVIWANLNPSSLLITQNWPEYQPNLVNEEASKNMDIIKSIITEIRAIRAEKKVEMARKIKAIIYAGEAKNFIEERKSSIELMARVEALEVHERGSKIEKAVWKFIDGIDIYLPLEGMFDPEKEKQNIAKKIKENEEKIAYYQGRLKNDNFRTKAPSHLIEEEERVLQKLLSEQETLQNSLNML